MIAYLQGTVAAANGTGAIIDVGGMGYELLMSSKALGALPAVGSNAKVWTYMQVKEDGISLFGFSDLSEKAMFERLITVSGVGPKMALAALSTYSAKELSGVIAEGDVTAITHISGVGKKTAQRIVLELQGVLKAEPASVNISAGNGALADASKALESMGFTGAETAEALRGLSVEGKDAGMLIKEALRNMRSKA